MKKEFSKQGAWSKEHRKMLLKLIRAGKEITSDDVAHDHSCIGNHHGAGEVEGCSGCIGSHHGNSPRVAACRSDYDHASGHFCTYDWCHGNHDLFLVSGHGRSHEDKHHDNGVVLDHGDQYVCCKSPAVKTHLFVANQAVSIP